MNVISIAADGAAEMEAALTHVVGQITEIREQMKADDAEIALIKAESVALKTESAALKTESAALKTETRTIIASLWSGA